MAQFGDPRLPDRFWDKVMPVVETGCWVWTGALSGGYGKFGNGYKRSPVCAHRLSYQTLVGPIPEGLEIDHLCRVRACCNPAHLEPVTRQVNMLRGETFAAANAAKTHCPQGHPYAGDNLLIVRGSRRCHTCVKANKRRYYRRKVARAA